jgi:hypothetical protein
VSYRIEHAVQGDVLRVTLSGAVDDANVGRLAEDVIALNRQRRLRHVLLDVRALADRVDTFRVVELVQSYPAESRLHRIAVLEDASQRQAHEFHETAALNRGYTLKHFTDAAAAEAWLKAATP